MSDRKPFLLRIDRAVLEALQRWANDDLRSLNGQIEFVLRRSLREAGRETGRPAGDSAPEAPVPPVEPQRPRKSDRTTE